MHLHVCACARVCACVQTCVCVSQYVCVRVRVLWTTVMQASQQAAIPPPLLRSDSLFYFSFRQRFGRQLGGLVCGYVCVCVCVRAL